MGQQPADSSSCADLPRVRPSGSVTLDTGLRNDAGHTGAALSRPVSEWRAVQAAWGSWHIW